MPLIRCSGQKRLTLEEFYKEFIPNKIDTFVDIGTPMLNVLKLINDTFKETVIYGLTSNAKRKNPTSCQSNSRYLQSKKTLCYYCN